MSMLLRRGVASLSMKAKRALPVQLHYAPTPNGWKVTLLLEEAQIPYEVVPIDLGRGDQLRDEFLAISPNGRMPALVDPNFEPAQRCFESGAIMTHLADTYEGGRAFLPATREEGRLEILQWLFWVNAGLGPMAGQLSHFTYYAPRVAPQEDHSYAVDRYRREYDRLISVMERQLASTGGFLGGNNYSIADMAAFPWVKPWRRWMGCGLDESGYPKTYAWFEAIKARPATDRAIGVLRDEARVAQTQREGGGGAAPSAQSLQVMFRQAGEHHGQRGGTDAPPDAPPSEAAPSGRSKL